MINQKDRLSRLLFLEFDPEKAEELFQISPSKEPREELYVPINPDYLIKKINNNEVPKDLPVAEFITGMAYALALDPEFKYAPQYRKMLKGYASSEAILKKKVAQLFGQKQKVEAYILLKGLYEVAGDEETENILLSAGEELALEDRDWLDEVLAFTDLAIANGNKNGWLIKGSLEGVRGNEPASLAALKKYIELGGEETSELSTRIEELERDTKAEEAYAMLYEDPKGALKIFLELYNLEADNPKLVYSIAVAYRLLGNHEKAIFYLEDAQAVDPGFFDVLNELGLNFALLEDYKTALGYFKTVFEATHEFAPMTNLIIALFQVGETEEARALYEEALAMDPNDEILAEIRKVYLD